jgi:glutathione S-transferase
MRATLPLGQLPVLEIEQDDGGVKVVPQSDAILRYVGSRSECLYPPAKALEIDSLIDTMTEFITPFVISFIGPVTALIADEEWTEADKMAMRKRILMTQIPKYFGYFEKILQENHESGWLVGEKLSIADLKWYGIVTNLQTGVVDGIPADVTDEYPRITEHIQKVRSVPEIKAWYDRFPQTPYPTFDYESPSSYSE